MSSPKYVILLHDWEFSHLVGEYSSYEDAKRHVEVYLATSEEEWYDTKCDYWTSDTATIYIEKVVLDKNPEWPSRL